ncbi:MAG: hypothetical protein H6621_08130 [Halobacteriovoraceae bacterium]|nr:hypothetical protein [Halobacteriovoraceae bacterium]
MLLVLISTFFVSCGGVKQRITDVQIRQTVENMDAILNLDAKLDLGNIYLPDLEQDIDLPGRGNIGTVKLGSDFISVKVNLSELVPSLETNGVLPNGAGLPLIGNNPVVVIPVRVKNSYIHVYVSLVPGATAIGVTIPFKELDRIDRYSAFFPPFNIKDVQAAAGLYTSETAGESGIGAFFNISNIISNGVLDTESGLIYVPMLGDSSESYEFDYATRVNSDEEQKSIDSVLYKLHRQKSTLSFE